MKLIGLTGGIACGKSTAVALFKELLPSVVVFDADECVAALYRRKEVLAKIARVFGARALSEDGQLNRPWVRQRVFENPELKEELQAIVHPMVREECLALREKAEQTGVASLFIADVPLLFEGGFDFGQEANLVVAVSRETQEQRLKKRDRFDDDLVHAILEAQLPISHKVDIADVVLWNEGPQSVLRAQIKRFIEHYE